VAPEHLLRGLSFSVKPFREGCRECKKRASVRRPSFCLVGMTGFEPATSSSRTKRATKLRYIPIRCKSNFTRIADTGA
jgi:hypothetical protein